jgi:Spy/CpxP family protein refolding chaperone
MRMNRYILLAFALLAGSYGLQLLTWGADAAQTAPSTTGRLGAARERMQQVAAELKLTEEQREKLRAIIHDELDKLRGLREDTNLTREQKLEKLRSAREEISVRIKDVLTPEQFEKWKAKQGQILGGAPGAGAPGGAVTQLQQAIRELNLTDAQKEQLKPIYEQQMEKLRDLRQDTTLTMAQKLEKVKALQEEIAPKLKEVLNPEQFAKWEKDVKQWLERLTQRLQQK